MKTLPLILLAMIPISLWALEPVERKQVWIKSDGGRFDVLVDEVRSKVTVAFVSSDPLLHQTQRVSFGKKPPPERLRTNVVWSTKIDSGWFYARNVSVVNSGKTVVVISPLVKPSVRSKVSEAILVYHQDGNQHAVSWRKLISKPVHDEHAIGQKFRWLGKVNSVDSKQILLTNARGGQLSIDLKTGKVRRIKYGSEEIRDPFDEPAQEPSP